MEGCGPFMVQNTHNGPTERGKGLKSRGVITYLQLKFIKLLQATSQRKKLGTEYSSKQWLSVSKYPTCTATGYFKIPSI